MQPCTALLPAQAPRRRYGQRALSLAVSAASDPVHVQQCVPFLVDAYRVAPDTDFSACLQPPPTLCRRTFPVFEFKTLDGGANPGLVLSASTTPPPPRPAGTTTRSTAKRSLCPDSPFPSLTTAESPTGPGQTTLVELPTSLLRTYHLPYPKVHKLTWLLLR